MRHTVRYGGIEPPPVSHERQAAFVSVYRIEAVRNVKESKARYLQAEKEENDKKGHVSEAACIGLPFRLCRWYHNSTDADNK